MDGQKDIWMDRMTNRWTEVHMDGQKDTWMDRRTHGWTKGHIDGQKDILIKKIVFLQ